MKPILKTHWQELAIWGGAPAFPEPLHVGRPNLGDRGRLMNRLHDALDRRWLTNDGPYVQELERELASLCGVTHCVAVASGTLALELSAAALCKREEATEVIVPSLTFIATAHAFCWRGLRPVFVDVDPVTLTLCPHQVCRVMSRRTAAVCGVHLFGQVCHVDALAAVAAGGGVPLMYDASHAVTNTIADATGGVRRVGQFGRLEAFSLHATKFIGCGEGGAIVTDDSELAAQLKRMRNFGFDDHGVVRELGINAKMSELAAAMGLSTLEQHDRFVQANRRNYEAYCEWLTRLPGIHVRACDTRRQNCQYVVIEVDATQATFTRDELRAVLRAERVLARPYFSPPCHQQAPYAKSRQSLPITERFSARLLALPTGECIVPEHIQAIGRIIELAQSRSARAA